VDAPRDQSTRYTQLDYWTDYARRLEAGLFDGIFFADVVGVYDVLGGSPDAAVRHAVQVPVNDPMLLIPAMASVTRHLGFGVTANLTYEQPFLFARRMSTLDHLTRGRIGWTSSPATWTAPRARPASPASWSMTTATTWPTSTWPSCVRCGRAAGTKAPCCATARAGCTPTRARSAASAPRQAIQPGRDAPERAVAAAHAGAVPGRRFIARRALCGHACGVRVPQRAGATGREEAGRVAAFGSAGTGRGDDAMRVLLGATIVTGRTDAEARDKFEDYQRHARSEAALVHAAASLGIDFAKYDIDEPIPTAGSQAIVSNVEAMTRAAGRSGRAASCSSSS